MRVTLRRMVLSLGILTLACSAGEITGPVAGGTSNGNGTGTGKGSGTTTPPIGSTPAAVIIAPLSTSSLIVGQSFSLTAAVKSTTGQDITDSVTVTWSSTNTSVASVSPTGILTAMKAGSAIISGAVGSLSSSVAVTIVQVPVSSVVVITKAALLPGDTTTASAIARDSIGAPITGRQVIWATSNSMVATITPAGFINAVGSGAAIITAIVDGAQGFTTIQVSVNPIATIQVALSSATLTTLGSSAIATATAKDAGGSILQGRSIGWTSSNPSIATVDQAGVVTAVSLGSATIVATGEGKQGSATVTVSQAPVATVTLSLTAPVLISQTTKINALLQDAQRNTLNNRPIVWASSNPAVVTVTQAGLVTGVTNGTAVITAVSEGITGSINISLPQTVGVLASVTLSAGQTVLQPQQQSPVTAVLRDVNNIVTTGIVAWSSSNPSVASVSSNGVVTALSSGNATITGTSGVISGALSYTVPSVSTVTVSTSTPTLQPTQSGQATVTLVGTNAQPAVNRAMVWSSSNPTVAVVSSTGYISAIASGTTNITVTSEGKTGFVTLTVPPVNSVTITSPSLTVQPTASISATANLFDASNQPATNRLITWTSSNPAAVTVTQTGTLSGVASGTSTITATSEGKTGTITVSVPPVATVTVTAPATTRQPGQTVTASFTLLDAAGQPCLNRAFSWSSSNTAVATVSSTGVVTPIASGTTQITVSSEGKTGFVTITVPPVATVNLTAANTTINGLGSLQVNAALLDASGAAATNRVITWSSSNTAVAKVSATGLVTAVSQGSTVITATSEGKSGTITISVVTSVGGVTVSSNATALLVGQTAQLSAVVLDAQGNPSGIQPTWTSSAPLKATVSSTGLVTAVNGGSFQNVVFTATAAGSSGTATIAVTGHQAEILAALPQVYLNTASPTAPAPGGQIISVSTAAQFNAALTSAAYGDVIEIANGVTLVGNFVLPFKGTTGSNWIVIRPANQGGLPAEGARMTPAIAAAANLPKIVSPNNGGAITTAAGTHHWRFIGIEFTSTANSTGLVRLGESDPTIQNQLSQVPHDLILDRIYAHSGPNLAARRCVSLNSASSAVVDSYLQACVDNGSDAQAIWGSNGPGPFKIVNNYLEGSGENVMFGGADPGIHNLIPSDIEIRHNHFYKPTSWIGSQWTVKNLFELKNSRRVLVDGNLFEHNWAAAQSGMAVNIKSANNDATAPWSGSSDVTFRNNIVQDAGGGLVIESIDDFRGAVVQRTTRITIYNNIFQRLNVGQFVGPGNGFMFAGASFDASIYNNTVMTPDNSAVMLSPDGYQHTRMSFHDNIVNGGNYGIKGDSYSAGNASIAHYTTLSLFSANVIPLGYSVGFPVGNSYPLSVSAVGFVSPGGFDWHLSGTSPFNGQGSVQGTSPGADVDVVNTATANVIVP